MDLNIKNYRPDELFNIFNLNLENLSLQNLKEQYLKKYEKIENSRENINFNKKEMQAFFTEAFTKLVEFIKQQEDTKKENLIRMLETERPSEEYYLKKAMLPKEKREKANPDDLINVENGLLLPLSQTPVIQTNMESEYTDGHQVQNYVKKLPMGTYEEKYKAGLVNPLDRSSNNIILNINSLFRNNVKGKVITNFANDISSRFTYQMPTQLNRITSLRLNSLDLPKTIYNISSNLGSNNFKISKYPSGYDPIVIEIPSGQYTSSTLVEAIQKDLSSNGTNVNVEIVKNTKQIRFYDISGEDFNLEFSFNREIVNENYCSNISNEIPNFVFPLQLTLGWILGFRKELYGENEFIEGISSNEYISEAPTNIDDSQYFFLGIKDYLNNNNQVMYSTFLENSNITGDIIARILYSGGFLTNIITDMREYFGPVRIQNLQITLYDMYGRILDLNNADFNLSLHLVNIYNL